MTDIARPRHRRAGLFTPFVLLLIVLAGWSVWWFYLAGQVKDRFEVQAQAWRKSGWTVVYSQPSVTGWPFRLRLESDNVTLAAPAGHALAAPRLVAQANAWDPSKWVLVATDGLTGTRAGKGKLAIRAQAIRASVHGLTQRWPNIAIELTQPVFTAHPGAEPFPIARAGKVEAYLRPHLAPATTPGTETSVDVLFRLIDAEGRSGGPVEGLTRDGKLTLQIESVIEHADQLNGHDPAGLFAGWSRAGGRFTKIRGEVSAGQSDATLSSDALSATPDGRLQGQVALSAERPMQAIAGLAGPGALSLPTAPAGANTKGDVKLTLLFRDGRTYLGPFALAPAPKLF